MQDLIMHAQPATGAPAMVLGLTGWMDGGRVSTATVGFLGERLAATAFAEINPDDFYIFNFPISTLPISVFVDGERAVLASVNPMESAAVFRPHAEIEDGRIKKVRMPRNQFWYSSGADLVLFSGEEPHLRWGSYCECVFEVARRTRVQRMIFVGSVAGTVPHTREPRIHASVTSETSRAELEALGVGFTTYRGPSSIITLLAERAPAAGIEFTSLVVEIPHYPFIEMPTYPRSILSIATALNGLLGLGIDLTELRQADEAVQGKLNAVMAENEEFRDLVTKLEAAHDFEQSDADEALLRQLIDGIDLGGEGE